MVQLDKILILVYDASEDSTIKYILLPIFFCQYKIEILAAVK